MHLDKTEIPLYGLYGEPYKRSELDFVHIEEIEDRSRDRDWIIKTHRHSKLFQVIYLEQGAVIVNLDGIEKDISGECLITIPAGIAHGFTFEPNSKGCVLSIQSAALFDAEVDHNQNCFYQLALIPQLIECTPEDLQVKQFKQFITHLKAEFKTVNINRSDALEWISKLALLSLVRLQQQDQVFRDVGVDSQMVRKFWSLLEIHYKDHWTVSDYAEQLHVSLSTFNRMCHKCFGEGAKFLIQERLLTEARRRLEYTQQTSAEIAFALGFKDQAYFSRYFKKLMQVTPGEYRAMKA